MESHPDVNHRKFVALRDSNGLGIIRSGEKIKAINVVVAAPLVDLHGLVGL
jgi:hypothetical protein